MPSDAERRKAARANVEVRVFRAGDREAEADADALYWDRIPVDKRAEFVWELSLAASTCSRRSAVFGSKTPGPHRFKLISPKV